MNKNHKDAIETLLARGIAHTDDGLQDLVPPIRPATTFHRPAGGPPPYIRDANPSQIPAETIINQLEGGVGCMLFASGMAACTALFQTLKPGDHVIAPKVMYWGLRKWLIDFCGTWGLALDLVDTTDLHALQAALRAGQTSLLWLETPSNPTWELTDIKAASELAHAAGAMVAVDGTVATPILTQPLDLGADFVVHSATKYLNGHSDVIAGAIVTAADNAMWQRAQFIRAQQGGMLGAFEAWLLARGLRTLHIRVRACCTNAMAIAEHFHGHAKIERVLYPGLPDHPQHALAKKQMKGGFSGMLSLRVKGGESAAVRVARSTRLFREATSLGGVESLVEHRASVEGPGSPVPGDLLRLSVGIEHVDDLIADLEDALATA